MKPHDLIGAFVVIVLVLLLYLELSPQDREFRQFAQKALGVLLLVVALMIGFSVMFIDLGQVAHELVHAVLR